MMANKRLSKEIVRLQQTGLEVRFDEALFEASSDNYKLGYLRIADCKIVLVIPRKYPFYPPRSFYQPDLASPYLTPMKRQAYLRCEEVNYPNGNLMDIIDTFDRFEGEYWSPVNTLMNFYQFLKKLEKKLYLDKGQPSPWLLPDFPETTSSD